MRRFGAARWAAGLVLFGAVFNAAGAEITVPVHHITADGVGEAVGRVTFADSSHGLLVMPDLDNLSPTGAHGAHVHANPSCAPTSDHGHAMAMAGQAAGGHYDPHDTDRHAGPYGDGHLGDLPNLIVEPDGRATIPVLAPRLAVADLAGRALMIHAEVDRYHGHGSHDHGKGGPRMYCATIE